METRLVAAILTGRATYFDRDGSEVRYVDLTTDYYATNHGETFLGWVREQVDRGELEVRTK